MGFEVGSLVECFGTDWTFVGRFFHVENFVNGQGSGLAEAFATFLTFEGFFFGVDISGIKKTQV